MISRRKNDKMEAKDVEALFTRVNDDPELQTRFKAVADETEFDALVAELGYDITYADFAEAASDAELTDEQLADVAGGELVTFLVAFGAGAAAAGILATGGIAGLAAATNAEKW
jgi:predicted ribosomally synthesized peptide with nif11-like leader